MEEFVAYNRTVDEIAEVIGADWLIYQDLEDLIKAVRKGNKEIKEFDCSCFDGKYVTRDVDNDYFRRLHDLRNDAAKSKDVGATAETVEL